MQTAATRNKQARSGVGAPRAAASGGLVVGLAGLCFASCATAPAPPALRAQLPPRYDATPAGAALPPAALDAFWTLYHDPELDALEREALSQAPDAAAAAARLRAAKATLSTALLPFNPQGDVTATAATQNTQLDGGNVDLSGIPLKVPLVALGRTSASDAEFDVSWELDLFGRRGAAKRVAMADLAAARFAYEGSRASLAAAVADSYFAARGLARQAEAARESATHEDAIADLVRMQVESGLASRADLSRAAVEIARAKARLIALEADAGAQRRSLLVLIGRGAAPLSALPISPAPAEGGDGAPRLPAVAPGDLLQRRPDVREAEARLRSAFGSILVDKLELFPHFSLLPGAGVSEESRPGNTFTTSLWSLGLGLAVPVLDRPRLLALVRAQDARAAEATAAYERTVQTAYGEAASVLAQLDADERQVAVLADAEAQARATRDTVLAGYGAGVEDQRSAVEAQEAWSSASAALAQARTQALRRSVQAFKALGGGWSEDDARGAPARRRSGPRPG
jgi:NodT family efflux transporter outer membrane factor (OMF) lipoprotein